MPKKIPAKAKTEQLNPRTVKPGQIILLKGTQTPEAVRSVEIVVNMANAQALVYSPDEWIDLVTNPEEAGYEDALTKIRKDQELQPQPEAEKA